MAIADGTRPHPLSALAEGAPATWFLADIEPRAARKLWISGSLSPAGAYHLDAGAGAALDKGKSLLPAGVTEVSGTFQRGDAVRLLAPSGDELGRGLSAYSATEARLIIGHNSREIESLLGYRGREELVHRDDLVLTRKARSPEGQGPGEKETQG